VAANGDASHISLNDGTCEGLAGEDFATVQFHPEASPGPLDALPFFDDIAKACRSARTFVRS
jgi:carbamoyl-phosphate synthase small subunit